MLEIQKPALAALSAGTKKKRRNCKEKWALVIPSGAVGGVRDRTTSIQFRCRRWRMPLVHAE